jgi:hypothetical protein
VQSLRHSPSVHIERPSIRSHRFASSKPVQLFTSLQDTSLLHRFEIPARLGFARPFQFTSFRNTVPQFTSLETASVHMYRFGTRSHRFKTPSITVPPIQSRQETVYRAAVIHMLHLAFPVDLFILGQFRDPHVQFAHLIDTPSHTVISFPLTSETATKHVKAQRNIQRLLCVSTTVNPRRL